MPNDTHAEASKEQVALLRRAQPHERLRAAGSLTQQVRALSLRGLAAKHRAPSDGSRLEWVRLVYGERLVRALGIDAPDR